MKNTLWMLRNASVKTISPIIMEIVRLAQVMQFQAQIILNASVVEIKNGCLHNLTAFLAS